MEHSAQIPSGERGVIIAVVIILGHFSAPVYCQNQNTALLLQQSPHQGGITTPRAGLYRLETGSEVILTAVPKTGYRFMFWLGDVVDPTASNTITFLDEPKVIVAVFERIGDMLVAGASGHGGSRRSSGGGGYAGGHSAGTPNRKKDDNGLFLTRFPQDDIEPQIPPVDEPIIPEPTTGILLVLGGLSLFGKRKA